MRSCRVWGNDNPREVTEHERDLPKVRVLYAFMKNKVTHLFFFEEPPVTGDTSLAMMEITALHPVHVGTVSQLEIIAQAV
jgi:hypothetical protein